MFINRLLVRTNDKAPMVIRDIRFHKGLNLIVDETSSEDQLQTGNSVGKTTVLRLIDFCLGAGKEPIRRNQIPWRIGSRNPAKAFRNPAGVPP